MATSHKIGSGEDVFAAFPILNSGYKGHLLKINSFVLLYYYSFFSLKNVIICHYLSTTILRYWPTMN